LFELGVFVVEKQQEEWKWKFPVCCLWWMKSCNKYQRLLGKDRLPLAGVFEMVLLFVL
jgi:hypothetical protein